MSVLHTSLSINNSLKQECSEVRSLRGLTPTDPAEAQINVDASPIVRALRTYFDERQVLRSQLDDAQEEVA